MNPEFDISRHPKAQLIERFTKYENRPPIPTPDEFRVAFGDLTAEEAADIAENSLYPFNVDVVGVLTQVYDDVETNILHKEVEKSEAKPMWPGVYTALLGLSAYSTVRAVQEYSAGQTTMAAIDAGFATLYVAGAVILDHRSHGTNHQVLKELFHDHCPPVFSPRAMEKNMKQAFAVGYQLGSSEVRPETSTEHNTSDQKEENLSDTVIGIVDRWKEGQELSPDEIRTLRLAKLAVKMMGVEPEDFCERGQEVIGNVETILARNDQNSQPSE